MKAISLVRLSKPRVYHHSTSNFALTNAHQLHPIVQTRRFWDLLFKKSQEEEKNNNKPPRVAIPTENPFKKKRDDFLSKLASSHTRLDINDTEDKGKGLFAKQDFNEGDIIFVEDPFISAPITDEYCSHCLKNISEGALELPSGAHIVIRDPTHADLPKALVDNPKVKKLSTYATVCPSCNVEKYCSHECLTKAKSYHNVLCTRNTTAPIYQLGESRGALESRGPVLSARIIAILVNEFRDGKIKCAKDEETGGWTLSGGSWDFVDCLERSDDTEDFDANRLETEYALIEQIFSSHQIPFLNMDFYRDVRLICMRNSALLQVQIEYFEQQASKEFSVKVEFPTHGAFLPYTATFLNHSCESNVSISPQHSHTAQWTASKPIHKGDELTVSYVSPSLPLNDRRELLWKKYGFWCECSLCTRQAEEEGVEDDLEEVQITMKL